MALFMQGEDAAAMWVGPHDDGPSREEMEACDALYVDAVLQLFADVLPNLKMAQLDVGKAPDVGG